MAFQIVTPPVVAAVELADMKAHLRVTSSAEDAVIVSCVAVATAEIEKILGGALITQTGEIRVPPFGAAPFEIQIAPLQEVVAVECILSDGSTAPIDMLDFEVWDDDGAAYLRVTAWPGTVATRPDAVKLTIRAGYGDAPEDIPAPLQYAVKLLAAHRFEHREEVVIGGTPAQIPRGVDALLGLYRRRWFQ
ncbi:MAG: phage head-tail connector protein [Thioclava sp.]|nr:head-tail connector protein [Thioclava sp.]MBD3803564.1 phage head-tail connector protein [Thioclava sp.]